MPNQTTSPNNIKKQDKPILRQQQLDLFKQFYALKTAAEVFQYGGGGHCISEGRNPAEINKEMAICPVCQHVKVGNTYIHHSLAINSPQSSQRAL